MSIGSLQHCENKPRGVKWKTCVKFLGIFITYDVQILVEKNFKQRLKKNKKYNKFMEVKGFVNSWQG